MISLGEIRMAHQTVEAGHARLDAAEPAARGRDQRRRPRCRRSAHATSSARRRCASTSPSSIALLPVQYSPENTVFSGPLSRAPRLRFTSVDEALVDVPLHRLEPLHVLRVLRQERVEHRLVLARRIEPPLDAELVHQPDEAEGAADHPDRADDRGRIADDLVAGAGDHVAAGGGDVLGERDHRSLVLGRELADAADRSGAIAPASRRAN